MEIRRVTSQGSETLDEFYLNLVDNSQRPNQRRLPQCMLDLLDALRADGPEPVVWGLTSMARLRLHATNDWRARTLVFISPNADGSWNIDCALPPDRCPWPDAAVTGHTEELAEAVRRVHLGLQWAGLLAAPTEAEPSAAPDRDGK